MQKCIDLRFKLYKYQDLKNHYFFFTEDNMTSFIQEILFTKDFN